MDTFGVYWISFNADNKASLHFNLKPKAIIRQPWCCHWEESPGFTLLPDVQAKACPFSCFCISTKEPCCCWQPHHPPGEQAGTSGSLNQFRAGTLKKQAFIPYRSKADPKVEDGVICDDDLNPAPLQEINYLLSFKAIHTLPK